ncbi:MAG: hypothetical protein KHX46_08485 [Clostridiales bacterium]|nr:hypothetical protein [Clostridiales bacterium]
MLKIGFIDYYLDEWHANNYPAWIKEQSGGEMEVAYAYGHIDSPIGGMTTNAWCEKYGIQRCATIEELIEKSDRLIVLSPDNCEMHEELCRLPMSSGKLTYVDKTFAPDYPAAKRIFDAAQQGGTPCYSTSALRFAEEYADVDPAGVCAVNCWGPSGFETYSIHQLEPLMMLMKAPARRVMYLPGEGWYSLMVEFADGRFGSISGYDGGSPFLTNIALKNGSRLIEVKSDFFQPFIANLVDFFRTGEPKVPAQETLMIMAVRGAGLLAQQHPGEWVEVEAVSD